MNIVEIYLTSVIFGFTPYLIERTVYQYKISKEGYEYNKDNNFFVDDIMEILGEIISSMIPVLNIVKGFKHLNNFKNFKTDYAKYKLDLLIEDKIYKEYDSKEEKYKDIFYTIADTYDMDEDDKKEFDIAIKIASLYEYACDNDYEIDDDFYYMSIDAKYNYLKDVKEKIDSSKNKKIEGNNKSKSYDEMTNKEKIEYLKKEKEDIMNTCNDKEKSLERKKN